MTDKTGGFAFPVSLPSWGDNGACGMTLRDYFAAKAMSAQIQNMHRQRQTDKQDISKWAYYQADAMLSERNKNDQSKAP